ncbi:hypothetical protein [Streptomyces sp. NPDC021020]|uniref:hypothetical protein n=1 Tax=Streptomyces sp. NPDC021020 TaxID=3365109 RepID=UPI00378750E7
MTRSDDLLAGLDDIDWATLGHAYGGAEDVPGQLRAVCGPDEDARESAFRSLFGNIFHQGTRYSASPYAVPFLSRIAVAGPPGARAGALLLLARLAVDWHDEYDLPLGIDTAAWRAAVVSPEENLRWYDEQIAGETDEERLKHLREGRAYCAAGHPVDSREGALRSYDAVRAQLPALLGLLADHDPDGRLRAYLDHEHPLPRWAAATAHHAGDLHSYTVRSLLHLRDATEDPDRVLLQITRALPHVEETGIVPRPPAVRAGNLLEALFEPADTVPVLAELSPGRREVLRVLAESLTAADFQPVPFGSDLHERFTRYGLPGTRPALRAYVGLPTEGEDPSAPLPDPWEAFRKR